MDEQDVRELFFERLEHLSPEAEYELRHPDYVMEMPQSGERIRGRENMRGFQVEEQRSWGGGFPLPAFAGTGFAGMTVMVGGRG